MGKLETLGIYDDLERMLAQYGLSDISAPEILDQTSTLTAVPVYQIQSMQDRTYSTSELFHSKASQSNTGLKSVFNGKGSAGQKLHFNFVPEADPKTLALG